MSDNPFALSNIEPQQDSAPASDNPFALGAIQRDQRQDLRVNLESAVRTNPQQAAEAARLAKKYETPDEVLLRNLQDVKLRDAVAEADKKLQTSPRLADYMRASPFALKQAHDDLDNLIKINGELKAWNGPEPTARNIVSGLAQSLPQGFRSMRAGMQAQMGDFLEWTGLVTPDPVYKADQQRKLAQAVGAKDFTTPNFESSTASAIYGGVDSTLRMLPGLAGSVATRSSVPLMASIGVQTQAEAYGKYRARGGTPLEALAGGTGEAVVEVVTEMPAMKFLTGALGRTGAGEFVSGLLARELPMEQVATFLQDAIDTAVANPDKTWEQFVAERPGAAYETLISTLTQSAIMGGVSEGARRLTKQADDQNAAQVQVQKLTAAMQAAEASTLRTNNPDEFRAVMEHLAQDGKVYVDAQVLNQLPPEQLQALGVVESLPEALAANSSVEVKLSDLLTHAPGTPAAQVLIDNARATPDGLSAIEVQQAGDQAGEFIKTEAERVLAEAQDATAWQDSTNKVKQGVLDQLNSAGRFSPEVNEAYATLQSSFFSVMAQRLGTTPEELFARYNLRVEAKLPGQGERLDQGGDVGLALNTLTRDDLEDDQVFSKPLPDVDSEDLGYVKKLGANSVGSGGFHVYVKGEDVREAGPHEFYFYDNSDEPIGFARLTKTRDQASVNMIAFTEDARGSGYGKAFYKYLLDELGVSVKSDKEITEGTAALYRSLAKEYGASVDSDGRVVISKQLNQSAEQPRLMAVHNLSAENLIFADKMGGLAVPSIGVVTQDAGAVDGFGEITLIGRKGLVDPKQERVFSADAYTVRFPKPEWPKVKSKDAQALVDFVRAAAKEFDDGGLTGETWDNMVNTPDAAKVVEKWTYSSAVKAMFLREKGVDVQPAMRPVRTTSGLTVEQFEALRPLYEQVSKQHDEGQYGTPEEAELKQRVEDGLRETYAELGKRDVMVDKMVEKATYRLVDTLYSDARAVQTGPTVDTWDTGKKINEQIEPYAIEFKQWVESKIIPKFGDPFIKVGGKKAPYTLDNIVKTMTDTKVKGKEKTMTYGAGQVRAAASVEFSDLEQMRAAAVENVVDPAQYEAAKAETEKKLEDYRSAVVEFTNVTNWKGAPDTWEALDASMRALAKWSTGKKRDATSMKAALRAEDFNVAKIPDSVIEQAMDAAGALLRAPVPYFEAKPQRAVSLGEFAGAVIPTDAPQQVRDILAKNNVPVTEYEPGADRTSTAREFAAQLAGQGQDTLFQTATPAPTSLPAEIEVDGKQRPTTNSNGQPIAATEEGVRNFWKWFGESAATERAVSSKQRRNELRPLVVYHGTRASFDSFAPVREGNVTTMFGDEETVTRHGIFFAESSEFADTFAKQAGEGNANVVPVYLKIENPLYLDEGFTDEVIGELVAAGLPDEQVARLRYRKADMAWAEFDDEDGAAMVSAIRAAGYDGALMVEPGVGVEGEDAQTVWVALDPTQIKSAIGNNGEFDPANPSILAQNSQAPRGTYSPSQVLITLGESADLSTFLHESGHFLLEVMADLASQPDAPAGVVDDFNTFLKWAGVKGDEVVGGADSGTPLAQTFTQNGPVPEARPVQVKRTPLETWNAMTLDQKRPYHEKWAESFEQYLLEGKAPTAELQPLFRRFSAWLKNVYKSLTEFMHSRNLQVSDEIRGVFDRMLAAEDQIKAAEQAAGMLPDFEATNEAIEKLQARSLRDLKWTVGARSKALKALQREAANLRKAVKAEVTAEVEQMPEFKAQREIAEFKRENKRKANDVELAIIAEANGFESADAMTKAIDLVGKKADMIEGKTDQRMLENFGELATPEALEAAANDAVHNEARARALATELKAQADMLNPRQDTGRTASNGRSITVNALTAAAKQFAHNLTARRRVKDLKNAAWQHRSAESRAAKAWQEATAKGKTEEAVAAKRDQLLNNYTAKAMGEAQAEVRKVLEFFAKVTKGNNEKLVDKGRDPDVVNAARAVLAAYDVAPRLEKTANDYMEAVAKYDAQMYGALKPGLDAMLANAKPFGELTVDEMRALRDEIGSMWELAKTSRQMEIDGDRVDIDDAAQDLVNRMVEIGVPDEIPGEKGAITNRQELGIKLQFAKAILSRVEQWAERMDGKFGGPFLRYVFQPVKDAADRYRTARVQHREKFTKLVEGVAPFIKPGPIAAPELGYTFGNARDSGMAELLHALIHTGNDSNKRKLLLGRNWATENADGTLDTTRWDAFVARLISEGTLRKEHYDFAQGVWDLLEETKPLAQEAHRKVFGRYFAEVTANEFTTPFGVYRGGYAPAQTDSRLVGDAKLRELAEGENESMAYAFPSAPSGFTKSRVEYNKPLLLDLRALAQHMDKVLLFSHMQPAISDARRLLTRKNVSYALDRIDPGAYEGMIMPWLNRSAKQVVETPVAGDRKLSRFLSAARSRAGMAMMMANLSNTVQQITGFSTAAIKVKPSLMLKAVGQFTASPKEFKRTVVEASPFMKDRMLNELSSMNDVVEQILVDPTLLEKGQAWTQKHAYFLQSAVDNTMSPIIWTAAYNQAIEEGSEARDAVRFADGVIRQTQGSTLPEDVSRFETGPAVMRVFTQFVGYFNMMANTNATAMSQVVSEMGVKKGAGKLAYIALAGLLAPIWVAEAIAQAFRGGPGDEDDDGYLDDWLMAVFGFGTLRGMTAQIPIAGQVGQMAVSRFNNNPADDKFSLSPAVSLIESAVGSPASVYKAIIEDGNAQKAVRDVAAAATLLTGLPFYAAARPVGYAAGVAQGKIEPTDAVDAVRGTVTGTASKESKTP